MNDRHVLSLLGPNGCGKGTFGKCFRALGAHVEVMSDILKFEENTNHFVAEEIRRHIDIGQNVPCQIVIDALWTRLKHVFRECVSGTIMLDGAGRTPFQIEQIADRVKNKKSKVSLSFVFLTLPFEEAMRRIENRIREHERRGIPVRSDDQGDKPARRYRAYANTENLLIESARQVASSVLVLDLTTMSSIEAAARAWGMLYGISAEDINRHLSQKIKVAA